jgi:hypothetical protein
MRNPRFTPVAAASSTERASSRTPRRVLRSIELATPTNDELATVPLYSILALVSPSIAIAAPLVLLSNEVSSHQCYA